MKKIVFIVGTRPNFIKAFPLFEVMNNDKKYNLTLIHTGQHFDKNMSHIFFEQMKCQKPNYYLNITTKTQAGQLGEIITSLEQKFNEIKPDLVLVFGDVTSTIAGALTAHKIGIKLAHVESGLRSGDLTMPEEVNRILVDRISDYHFVTEPSGQTNLEDEGIGKDNVYLVGNTMIDSLMKYKKLIDKNNCYKNLKLNTYDYIVITLHRPSNVDDIDKLKLIISELCKISGYKKLVWPIHPRTRINLSKLNNVNLSNILLVEPLGYLEFMNLVSNSYCVITDSGGIQEETTVLDIPCFTLRDNTERPITLIENGGTNMLVNINNMCDNVLNCGNIKNTMNDSAKTLVDGLTDGLASQRILDIIQKILKD
jgi:UDP-N-acetylglucosamine 2-epimerase (non-hydrolysing)